MPQLRIGISGWTYGPWRGTFYPKDLPQKNKPFIPPGQLKKMQKKNSDNRDNQKDD